MSDATIGYGSKLKRGDGGAPEIFTAIAEVVTFDPPGGEADEVEVTNLDSADRRKEHIQGMIESGEVAMEMNFLPTDATQNSSTGLIADLASGTVKNWQLLYSDAAGTTATFAGFIKAFAPGTVETGAALRATATIKVTGGVVWGP